MEYIDKFFELIDRIEKLVDDPRSEPIRDDIVAIKDLSVELQNHYVIVKSIGPGTEDFVEKYNPMIMGTCNFLYERYGLNSLIICEYEKNYAIASRMDPEAIYLSLFAILKNIPRVYDMLMEDLKMLGLKMKGDDSLIPIYIIQKSDKSRCKHCEKYVELLIERDANPIPGPIFFICFDCRRVFQAGVGEVEREDSERG